jgi:hypothetical protein
MSNNIEPTWVYIRDEDLDNPVPDRIGPPYYHKSKTVLPNATNDTQAYLRWVFLWCASKIDESIYPDLQPIISTFQEELADIGGIRTYESKFPRTEDLIKQWVSRFHDDPPWLYDEAWDVVETWAGNQAQFEADGLKLEPSPIGRVEGPRLPNFEPPEPRLWCHEESFPEYEKRFQKLVRTYLKNCRLSITQQGYKTLRNRRKYLKHIMWLAIWQLLGASRDLIANEWSASPQNVARDTKYYADLIGLKRVRPYTNRLNPDQIKGIQKQICTLKPLVDSDASD